MTVFEAQYRSTRDSSLSPCVSLGQLLLGGLAPDGGLYVCTALHSRRAELPALDVLVHDTTGVRRASDVTVSDLTMALLSWFLAPYAEHWPTICHPDSVRSMVQDAFATFSHPEVTPLVSWDRENRWWGLEAFHGPTLSFKDVALQVLARLFARFVAANGTRHTVLLATSGDTGAAAVAALAGQPQLNVVVLHPDGGIAPRQRRQMTTVRADNVYNLAVQGTFDDCQHIVKQLLRESQTRTPSHELPPIIAVNSINWFRLAIQMSYHFFAALAPGGDPDLYVPTGNFGNVLAAGYARCWLNRAPIGAVWTDAPKARIGRIVAGTNVNDAVVRLLSGSPFEGGAARATVAPAMDIVVPSNFERYVHLCFDEAADGFQQASKAAWEYADGSVWPEGATHQAAWPLRCHRMQGVCATDDTIRQTIAWAYDHWGVTIDPHTATAVHAARVLHDRDGGNRARAVIVSTAHPSKFEGVMQQSLGIDAPSHPLWEAMANRPERYRQVAPADVPDIVRGVLQ